MRYVKIATGTRAAGLVAAAILGLATPVVAQRPIASTPLAAAGPEAVDRATQTIAIGPNGTLDLRNVSGDITVTAGTGKDASLEVVRRSRARSDADAKLGLDRVQATVAHTGTSATVSVNYPRDGGRQPYDVEVSYIVTAPAGTRITAASISGSISIKNIKGDVSAQVISGNVTIAGAGRVSSARSISGDITLSDVTSDAALVVGTVSGDVRLDRVKAGRLEADTTSGDVRVRDAAVSSASLKSLSGEVEYVGTVARSGRYELNSHSGDVHIEPAAGSAGFELQATTFSGDIRANRTDLRNVRKSSRSLAATVGDGGATVVISTFSGDVVVGGK